MTKHRLDPMHLHHAAGKLGEIVAAGEMSDADASGTIKSWCVQAAGIDRSGLQARLHWTMRDHAAAAQRARENAVTAIRWAVRPLFSAKASAAEIEEAAGKANGAVLPWEQVAQILREELSRALKQRRG
jgi:hypothetical protein